MCASNLLRTMAVCLLIGSPAWAVLSGNLMGGGDFEDTSYLKLADSPRTQAEIDALANPVRAWQFHQGGIAAPGEPNEGEWFDDFGKWMGAFGMSTVNSPRTSFPGTVPAMTNVSLSGGNHFMEATFSRPWAGQIIKAPAGQIPGAAKLDFDFYFHYWDPVNLDATPQLLQPLIIGINEADLPTWQDRWGPHNNDDWMNASPSPGSSQANWEYVYIGANFNSLEDESDSSHGGTGNSMPYIPDTGDGWHSYSDGWSETVGDYVTGTDPWLDVTYHDGTFNITQTYDYYYVVMRHVVYSESHPYWWMNMPHLLSDAMSVAFDNVSLQLQVPEPATLGLLALGGLAILRRRR